MSSNDKLLSAFEANKSQHKREREAIVNSCVQMSKGVQVQWRECRGRSSRTSSSAARQWWEMEDILTGLWIQTCNSLNSCRPKEQISPITASLTHAVPLTHAMVYCSGLRVAVCCSGALGPTHPTANLYSVWTPRHLLLPLLSFQILFSLGVFGCQHRWLAPSLWIYNKINSLTASLSTSI